jgi:hypothetical protein
MADTARKRTIKPAKQRGRLVAHVTGVFQIAVEVVLMLYSFK